MDFGSVGLDGLVDSDPDSAPDAPPDPPEPETKSVGSGTSKQGRPTPVSGGEEWRSSKLIKTADDISVLQTMPKDVARSNTAGGSLFSDGHHQQHMLSFSSSSSSPPKSETRVNSQSSSALPYLSYTPSLYNTFAGFGNGNQNGGSMQMQGVFNGTRGPFTPSQWIELEHQALIYKYITANIPIPSNLLVPIKKAFDSTGFSCYPGGYLRSNSLGWGSFYLGFSNTGDPEPGRCRRTDGKKWRCARDAVVDQKYCEKHMNRGRHRSRKPVEGQNGHPIAGTTSASVSLKKMSAVSSASVAGPIAAAVTGGGASNSLAATTHHQQQVKSLHSSGLPADPSLKRFCGDQENVNEKNHNPFLMMKQQLTFEDASRLQFGVDNLLDCRGFASSPSQDLGCIPETDTARGLVHQFIDDWPENSVGRSPMSWSNTHLSVSIPMASSDLISATSSPSPTIDRTNLSPLRLSRKSDPNYMNRGVVGTVFGDPTNKQNILWESSMGGPLGEVLHNTGNTTSWAETRNSSLLNLMKDGWDKSPSMGSSPTGVLQKTTFRSLSNSSTGSSPRAENKPMDGIHIAACNELLGSTLANY